MITRKEFLHSGVAGLAAPALLGGQSSAVSGSGRQKNVLLLISDQHHPRAMSFLGDGMVRTPNLDALAAESMRFESAYCGNPVCGPSRASLMTGQYTHRHRVFKNDVPWPADLQTMGSYFSRAGYLSGTIGKAHFADGQTHGYGFKLDFNEWYQYLGPKTHLYAEEMGAPNGGSGLPEVFSSWNGKDPWKEQRVPAAKGWAELGHVSPMEEEDHFEAYVARESVRFIEQHGGKQPFFLIASFLKPHAPFTPVQRFVDSNWKETMKLPETWGKVDPATVPKYIQQRLSLHEQLKDPEKAKQRLAMQNGCINQMDHCLGEVMKGLKAAGLEDDTIVVYTADHGEMRGEHGLWDKFVFYDASAGVPLLVKAPGVTRAGAVSKAPVSQLALVATLMDLCGLGAPNTVDEPSLVPFLRDTGRRQERAVYSEFSMGGQVEKYMMRRGEWKYCYYMGDTNELYNMEQDPKEMRNLVNDAKYKDVAAKMQKEVLEWRHA